MWMTRIVAAGLVVALCASPVKAQGLPVFDVADLIQIIEVVRQVRQTYELAQEQWATFERFGRGMSGLDRYRIPGLPFTGHDAGRFPYATGLLQMLNEGDPSYAGYWASTQRLRVPGGLFGALQPEAQQVLRAAYAGIELTDSISTVGGHQVGLSREYHWLLNQQIEQLESDVIDGPNEMTANLDKQAALQLTGLRQSNTENQLIASLLETKLAELKRKRDAEAARMNGIINQREDNGATSGALVSGASAAIQGWRLP